MLNGKYEAIKVQELKGMYTALITPVWHGTGEIIDYTKLETLMEDQINAGVNGLVIAGSTGQSFEIGLEEHIYLVNKVSHFLRGRTKLIVGIGPNGSMFERIDQIKRLENETGSSFTFLNAIGAYTKPSNRGVFSYYLHLADSMKNGSNLILYNVPSRTGINIEPEIVIELSKHPKIIGIKEASGNVEQVEKIIKGTNPDEFRVLSGEDSLVVDIMKRGGYGVISASANLAPLLFVRMVNYALEDNFDEARKIQERLKPIIDFVFCNKCNPVPLTQAFDSGFRLPLVEDPTIEGKIELFLRENDPSELGLNLKKYRRR